MFLTSNSTKNLWNFVNSMYICTQQYFGCLFVDIYENSILPPPPVKMRAAIGGRGTGRGGCGGGACGRQVG
jgi:hypothetical protein